MQGDGSFSDTACRASGARVVAWHGSLRAHSVPRRHRGADRVTERLVELDDPTRSASDRCEIAAVINHDLDSVFTQARRLPRARLHQLVARYDRVLHDELVPDLGAEGITFPRWDELSPVEQVQMQRRFHERTFPLFTPMAVDSTHPLPQLPSLALNVGLKVDGRLVVVKMSPHLPRLLAVRRGRYLTLESFVGALLPQLLVGVRLTEHTAFRVTRSVLGNKPVRLEVERGSSGGVVDALAARLGLADGDVYRLRSSLAMGAALAVQTGRAGSARRPSRLAWTGARTEAATEAAR